MSSAASNSYYATEGWTVEYVTGDSARITIEGNDLKQQTAPHNHACGCSRDLVPAIYNEHLIFLTFDLNFTLTSFVGYSGVN